MDTFELVDTDDNTVEVVTKDLLFRAVMSGVTVLGCTWKYSKFTVRAVQDPREFGIRPKPGVRLCVFNDEITAIDVEDELLNPRKFATSGRSPVEIRLSRCARSCGNFILRHLWNSGSAPCILLKLDDKIELSDTTFLFGTERVIFDLSEVTRLDTVFKVYNHCYGEASTAAHIIDDCSRRMLMESEIQHGWYDKWGFRSQSSSCYSPMDALDDEPRYYEYYT